MKLYAVMLVTLGIATAASAQDADRFRYFQEHGIMDPGVSSEAANFLVLEGIGSEDPEVVDMTIRALGNLAAVLAHNLPNKFGKLPSRAFSRVPGLKEFLIKHWREQHEKAGRNTFEVIMSDFGRDSPDGVTMGASDRGIGPEVTDDAEKVDPDARFADVLRRASAWTMIPQILSVYWPGDSEVEQFLYEMHDTDGSRLGSLTTLGLLNTGKFTSEIANTFRISQLDNPELDISAPLAATWAAKGLALSRPVDALPALLEAGAKYPAARGEVMVVVAGYEESELELYAKEIDALLQRGIGPMSTDAATEAIEKLDRLFNRALE